MALTFKPRNAAEDDPMYNPHRDIAVLGKRILKGAVALFNERDDHDFELAMRKMMPASDDDEIATALEEVKDVYVSAMSQLTKTPGKGLADILEDAGWEKLQIAPRFGFLALVGEVFLQHYLSAMRDNSKFNGPIPKDVDEFSVYCMGRYDAARHDTSLGEQILSRLEQFAGFLSRGGMPPEDIIKRVTRAANGAADG